METQPEKIELLDDNKTPAYAKTGEELKPGQTRVEVINLADPKGNPVVYKNQKTIHFEHHSMEEGKVYAGTFTMRRLPVGEAAKMEAEKARVNAGISPTYDVFIFNNQLVDLKYMIMVNEDTPPWFKKLFLSMDPNNPDDPDKLYDVEVINRLSKEVLEFDTSFRRPSRA